MDIKDSDLKELFKLCGSFDWSSKMRADPEVRFMQDRCNALLSKDYKIGIINNTFCSSYPLEIVLMGDLDYDTLEDEDGIHKTREEILASINNHEQEAKRLEKLMEESKLCRCRQRIPAPVLVVRGRTVARSAALSESLEYAYQTGDLTALSGAGKGKMRQNRTHLDTTWLNVLHVKHICDLMVENIRKIMTLRISTSENASMEYQNAGFHVSKLPYPGVEAFLNYTNHVKSISFPAPSWKKLDSELRTAVEFRLPEPYNWKQYQTWTLIELTQNYIRYMLHLLRSDPDPKAGILIHCISGWDRTPMFVSLLRLLMWAEGEAHQSLNVNQMLYLTVTYDWVLFGHQLGHRLSNRHEIIYFCFYVLQHLLSDEFSLSLGPNAPEVIALQKAKQEASSSSSSSSTSTSSSSSDPVSGNDTQSKKSHPLSDDWTPPSSPVKSPSASSLASPRSPKPRPPASEEELSDRQNERKHLLFELSSKFLQFWNDFTEPVYKK